MMGSNDQMVKDELVQKILCTWVGESGSGCR